MGLEWGWNGAETGLELGLGCVQGGGNDQFCGGKLGNFVNGELSGGAGRVKR